MKNNSTFTMKKANCPCRCIHRRRVMHCRLRVSVASMASVYGMVMSSPWRGQRPNSEGGCAHELDHPTDKSSAVATGRHITACAAERFDSCFDDQLRWCTRN